MEHSMEKDEKFLFEHIIQNMPDGIIVVSFEGKISICNPSASKMLGFGKDELVGKSIAFLMNISEKNDEFFSVILDTVYAKSKISKTLPYFEDTGCKYYHVTTDYLTHGGEKLGLIATISDRTDEVGLFISNKRLANQVITLMNSFVEVIVTAVEEKSPYNANHTKNMVRYASGYLDWLRERGELSKRTAENTAPFLMSVWLHDMGKLLVPPEILDKPTRLGNALDGVLHRIETAQLMLRIKMAEEKSGEPYRQQYDRLAEARELILTANTAGFLSDDTIARLSEASELQCLTAGGESIPLLSSSELEAITVVKGTLTDGERRIIESHVSLTQKLLSKMEFRGEYKKVPFWAGSHHEFIDGSGYPDKLGGNEIPWETRLLTIIDIYDALTAEDRPYKPPMPPEKAFAVLRDMSAGGKLDSEILESFCESGVWKK